MLMMKGAAPPGAQTTGSFVNSAGEGVEDSCGGSVAMARRNAALVVERSDDATPVDLLDEAPRVQLALDRLG